MQGRLLVTFNLNYFLYFFALSFKQVWHHLDIILEKVLYLEHVNFSVTNPFLTHSQAKIPSCLLPKF